MTVMLLFEFIENQCLHGQYGGYLAETTICQTMSCKCCQTLIGRGLCTPDTSDGLLRAEVLAPMIHRVKDLSDSDHFLKPEFTRKHINEFDLIIEDLKKQIPKFK
eukprot:815867-Ditylum_brightwellii.AAC.1